MAKHPRLLFFGLGIAIFAACSANNASALDNFDTGPSPTDTADTDDPPPLDASWFNVDVGQIQLVDGDVVAGSTLTVSLWNADLDGSPVAYCTDTVHIDTAPATTQPDDAVALYGMWTISLATGACAGRPGELEIGIGPLVPDLWPSASGESFSLKQTRGLYVSNADRDGLWVFGLAGTTQQLAGLGAPPSLDPLPDGAYLVRGYYLLPL